MVASVISKASAEDAGADGECRKSSLPVRVEGTARRLRQEPPPNTTARLPGSDRQVVDPQDVEECSEDLILGAYKTLEVAKKTQTDEMNRSPRHGIATVWGCEECRGTLLRTRGKMVRNSVPYKWIIPSPSTESHRAS